MTREGEIDSALAVARARAMRIRGALMYALIALALGAFAWQILGAASRLFDQLDARIVAVR